MSSIRFLIADDSAALQAFLRQLLEDYGFDAADIKTTNKPDLALEIAQELKPDFLLTDWFADEALQGLALYQQVLETNPGCQFAMVGRDRSPAQIAQAEAAGARFFLAKPFGPNALRKALSVAMEQLAKDHPKLIHHLSAQHPHEVVPQEILASIVRPPVYKAGEQVLYQQRPCTVQYVILRRGELVVQLHGVAGLIPASEVRKS